MELWDIYDRQGNRTGRTGIKGQPLGTDEYQLVVEAWVINANFEILLQRRSPNCRILPNVWCHTTGRITAGESSLQGCMREVQEELGVEILPDEIHFLQRISRDDNTHMIWDIFLIRKNIRDTEFKLQPSEVAAVKWVSEAAFRQMIHSGECFQYPEIFDVLDQIKREWRPFE